MIRVIRPRPSAQVRPFGRHRRTLPEAAAGRLRFLLQRDELLLILHVGRERGCLGIALAHQFRVHHDVTNPHITQQTSIVISFRDILLQPDCFSAHHAAFLSRAAAALAWPISGVSIPM